MSFDPAFVFYRDDREIIAWETLADMADEADAELASRNRLYPGMVNKGRMPASDAQREIRVMTSIANQLRGRPYTERASWTEQVHCLRREIALRRQLYPGWILQGRVDADEADRKLRMFESIHDMWWHGDWSAEAIAGRAATWEAAAA